VSGTTRVLAIAILASACGDPPTMSSPPPANAERTPSPPPVRLPPDAAQFARNHGRDVLDEGGVSVANLTPGAWEGRWIGTQRLSGGISGNMSVDMTIERDRDGGLRFVQSAFGVTVVQHVTPSPDNPQLAAGTAFRTHAAGEVVFTSQEELTAIVSGDRATIGMYVETIDPGRFRGQQIPKGPPMKSITTLERARTGSATPARHR
jgi:hypothetical protein